MKWADLRFFAWSKSGFDQVLNHVAEVLGQDPREPVMYDHILSYKNDPSLQIFTRYRREPLIEGVRGWDNKHYSRGLALIKYYTRAMMRKFAPFIEI